MRRPILALSEEIRGQSSGNLGQPPSDFVQTWSGAGLLECAPETLGELDVHLAGARGTGGRSDEQRDMLILREVQRLQRLEHAVRVDGFYLH